MKNENTRLEEIEEFFRVMQKKPRNTRNILMLWHFYLKNPLRKGLTLNTETQPYPPGEIENARLEPDSNRN